MDKEKELGYMEIREQICDVCHKMWQLGWVAANDGNVSVKLEDGTFLATPTGISKSFITPEKILHIDSNGEVIEGQAGAKPSSEIKMHLRCYEERDDVGAVVHAHPPTATGYAVAHLDLDRYTMIETIIAIGSIPVTPYGTPSTISIGVHPRRLIDGALLNSVLFFIFNPATFPVNDEAIFTGFTFSNISFPTFCTAYPRAFSSRLIPKAVTTTSLSSFEFSVNLIVKTVFPLTFTSCG